jgi:ubiquinone/menaquinone biosynthesis C-methylase UbiE
MFNNPKGIDILNKITGLSFIDSFLGYTDMTSDNRFYHMIKASFCRDFIEQHKSPDKFFLDAGSGRGPYTKIAQNKYKKIYSYEYNTEELGYAIKNLNEDSGIFLRQVDITNIPLDDNVIDVGVCSEVLEHILDYNKAMSELYRVIKPGGYLLFSMPNNHSLLYGPSHIKNRKILVNLDSKHEIEKRWEQLRHFSFNYKKIESIATRAGFRIIERQGANVVRIPSKLRKMLMRRFPTLFKIYFKINLFFAKILPSFGSFYFLTLQK